MEGLRSSRRAIAVAFITHQWCARSASCARGLQQLLNRRKALIGNAAGSAQLVRGNTSGLDRRGIRANVVEGSLISQYSGQIPIFFPSTPM